MNRTCWLREKRRLHQCINASAYQSWWRYYLSWVGPVSSLSSFRFENFFTDIHKFMRTMEEAVIKTLQEFGIESGRLEKTNRGLARWR